MSELGDVLAELPRERTQLLDNLGTIRRRVGPVTPELSDALADHMNIRRGEVAEVVSFYSYLQRAARLRARVHGAGLRLLRRSRPAREGAGAGEGRRSGDRGAVPRPLRPRAGGDARRHDPAGHGRGGRHARGERRALDRARAGRRDPRRLRAARRARGAAGRALERGRARGARGVGARGLRRRRLPDLPQVGDGRPVPRAARRRRQRRRGRAGHDQGPLRHGAAAASARRGHGDRGAVRRGRARDRLPARGVRDRARASGLGDRGVPRGRPARARCPWRS